MQEGAGNAAVPDDVEPGDRGHCALADHIAVGVVVALPPVDEAALKTVIGDIQRLVGAEGISRLNDPDPVDRPLFLDFDDIRTNAYPAEPDRHRQSADAASHDQHISNCGHERLNCKGGGNERAPPATF